MLHFKCLGSTCPSCQSINILRTLKAYDCHLVQSTCSINACYKKISNSSWFSFFLCLLKCLGTTSISFPRAIQPAITVLSPPPSTLWSRTLWIWAPVRPLQTKPFNCHLGSWPYVPYKVVLRSLWHTGYLPLSNIYYFINFRLVLIASLRKVHGSFPLCLCELYCPSNLVFFELLRSWKPFPISSPLHSLSAF